MAYEFIDTFTDTTGVLLENHTPDTAAGRTWERWDSVASISMFSTFTGIISVKDNPAGTGARYMPTGNFSSSNHMAKMALKVISAYNNSGTASGILGDFAVDLRVSDTGLADPNGRKLTTAYRVGYRYQNNTWFILRIGTDTASGLHSQTATVMASIAAPSPLVIGEAQRYFDVEVSGTNPVLITLKEGGTTILSYSDSDAARVQTGLRLGVFGNTVLGNDPYLTEVQFGVLDADAVLPTMNGSLSSSSITSSSFTLSWPAASDNVAVTGYEHNIGAGWVDDGSVLTKNITGLTPSTTYSTQVRAYDAAGNRAASPLALSVDTIASSDGTAPTMNGSLVSSSITASGFTLTWPAASDNVAVTGYEFSTNSGSSWTDAGNVLTRAVTGLAPSTLYATRVRAYDAAGNRAATPLALDVTTASGADTTLPTLSGSIIPSAITASGFTISWPAGADNVAVTGYEYSTNGGSSYTDAGNVLTKAITSLTAGTAYAVRVRAYDAAGNRSTPALATTVTTLVTITQSLPFKNIQGGLQANMACRVSIMDKATDAVVATKTGLSTDSSGALAPFTVSGLAVGTEYRCMLVGTADGAGGLFLTTPA